MNDNPFDLPILPPSQTQVMVRKIFASQFVERRNKEPHYVTNRAIILDMLSDKKWSEWGAINSYMGAWRVLNEYAPALWEKTKQLKHQQK